MEKQRAETQRQAELQKPTPQATPGTTPQAGSVPAPAGTATTQPASAAPVISREAALEASPLIGSKARAFPQYCAEGLRPHRRPGAGEVSREMLDPKSPAIVLFSPSQTTAPYYAEFGWVPATGSTSRIPDQNTMWQQEGSGALTPTSPVTLKYDNGDGVQPSHDCDRRPLPLHHQGRGLQCRHRAGHALPVRADLAPRHAGGLRLLHPA